MTCTQCDCELICRMKDYGGNFAPTLQWQNYDGTAHYKTTDGKNFECNVPDDDETAQTRIPSQVPPATTPGTVPPGTTTRAEFLIIAHLEEKIDDANIRLQKMDEMIQAIFRYTVNKQLEKK